ncbi:MAG: HAMP domain-containing sensor histidine kinase [Bacteroidota bacterium]|nr:HAMP domain-containing sensor histidine kinase [Bacteroidota bacterium]MDP4191732.1 HAMP domain-containing sensor histidine kinase [Bacteroidota bacterium]MDP4193492.1 HAMP domain-containing sensor histidine kinase [Bacteroidota bacterium]
MNKYIKLLFLLFILAPVCIFSQDLRINRNHIAYLRNSLSKETDLYNKCKLYNLLAEEYIKAYGVDSSKYYSHKSLEIAQKKNWKSEEAVALKNIVKANRANFFNNEYLITRRESFENISRAIELFEQLGDQKNLAECNWLFGSYFYVHSAEEKAFGCFSNALSISQKIKDSIGIARSCNSIGLLYSSQGKYDLAQKNYDMSLQILNKHIDTTLLISVLVRYSNLMNKQKRSSEALKLIGRVSELSKHGNNQYMLADIYNDIGIILIGNKKDKEAIGVLDSAYQLASKFKAEMLLSSISDNLAIAYHNLGDYKNAYLYKDSVLVHTRIYQKTMRQNALEAEIHNLQLEKNKEQIREENFLILYLSGFLCIVIFMLYLMNRQKHKANRLLEEKNKVISDQNEELDEINRSLEDRINERTGELMEAKEKAEMMNKLKSDFLAQMSHEIRTPVNTILSFASLIKSELEGKINDDIFEGFQVIDAGGRRLIRTIDMILTMSQFQTGSYEAKPVRMDLYDDILLALFNEFKQVAKLKGLDLKINKFSENSAIQGDSYSVLQLFQNLIDNAIKYTMKGTVEIRMYQNEDGMVSVDIIDTGIGISDKFISRIFDPFSQEETGYTRRFEGNGLGLALVKNYAEINNIEINVSSKKNSGTIFTITFPKA